MHDAKTKPSRTRAGISRRKALRMIGAAGALISTLPVALIFLAFQKMLMSGLAAGAVKG